MERYQNIVGGYVKAFESISECPDNSCENCVVWKHETENNLAHRCTGAKGSCLDIMYRFLKEDVYLESRWRKITRDEDLEKMFSDYCDKRQSDKLNESVHSFCDYLLERVEYK